MGSLVYLPAHADIDSNAKTQVSTIDAFATMPQIRSVQVSPNGKK